jgi:fatty acid desaturase
MSSTSSASVSRSGGIGFAGLLAILFIALKLGIGNTVVVTWPWLWVLAPIWIPFALVFGIYGLVLGFAGLIWLIATIMGKK